MKGSSFGNKRKERKGKVPWCWVGGTRGCDVTCGLILVITQLIED